MIKFKMNEFKATTFTYSCITQPQLVDKCFEGYRLIMNGPEFGHKAQLYSLYVLTRKLLKVVL